MCPNTAAKCRQNGIGKTTNFDKITWIYNQLQSVVAEREEREEKEAMKKGRNKERKKQRKEEMKKRDMKAGRKGGRKGQRREGGREGKDKEEKQKKPLTVPGDQ